MILAHWLYSETCLYVCVCVMHGALTVRHSRRRSLASPVECKSCARRTPACRRSKMAYRAAGGRHDRNSLLCAFVGAYVSVSFRRMCVWVVLCVCVVRECCVCVQARIQIRNGELVALQKYVIFIDTRLMLRYVGRNSFSLCVCANCHHMMRASRRAHIE